MSSRAAGQAHFQVAAALLRTRLGCWRWNVGLFEPDQQAAQAASPATAPAAAMPRRNSRRPSPPAEGSVPPHPIYSQGLPPSIWHLVREPAYLRTLLDLVRDHGGTASCLRCDIRDIGRHTLTRLTYAPVQTPRARGVADVTLFRQENDVAPPVTSPFPMGVARRRGEIRRVPIFMPLGTDPFAIAGPEFAYRRIGLIPGMCHVGSAEPFGCCRAPGEVRSPAQVHRCPSGTGDLDGLAVASASSAADATARVRIASAGAQKTYSGSPERTALIKRPIDRSNGSIREVAATDVPSLIPVRRKSGSRSRRSAVRSVLTSTQYEPGRSALVQATTMVPNPRLRSAAAASPRRDITRRGRARRQPDTGRSCLDGNDFPRDRPSEINVMAAALKQVAPALGLVQEPGSGLGSAHALPDQASDRLAD